jgi:hypothetical protein
MSEVQLSESRRVEEGDGEKDERMSDVQPTDNRRVDNGPHITAAGLEAAITLYTRLIQWYPVRRRNDSWFRFRINWYPTLFTLRINLVVLRETLEIERLAKITPTRDRNALGQKVYIANKARAKTLLAIRELAASVTRALDPPHNYDKDLLELRGQLAEWEARVVFPVGRVGDGLFDVVRKFENASESQRESMVRNLSRYATEEASKRSRVMVTGSRSTVPGSSEEPIMVSPSVSSSTATPRAMTIQSSSGIGISETTGTHSRETSSRNDATVLSFRTAPINGSSSSSGMLSSKGVALLSGSPNDASSTPRASSVAAASKPSNSNVPRSSLQPASSLHSSSSAGPTNTNFRTSQARSSTSRSPSLTPVSERSTSPYESGDQEWADNIVYMWTRFVSHASKPHTVDDDDGLSYSTDAMKSWLRKRRRLLRMAEEFHERARNADDEMRRTRKGVRGASVDE